MLRRESLLFYSDEMIRISDWLTVVFELRMFDAILRRLLCCVCVMCDGDGVSSVAIRGFHDGHLIQIAHEASWTGTVGHASWHPPHPGDPSEGSKSSFHHSELRFARGRQSGEG